MLLEKGSRSLDEVKQIPLVTIDTIRNPGLELPDRPHHSDLGERLVNVFLTCEASRDGKVRGRRNAMLDDSDVPWHRQIKATVGGVAAIVKA